MASQIQFLRGTFSILQQESDMRFVHIRHYISTESDFYTFQQCRKSGTIIMVQIHCSPYCLSLLSLDNRDKIFWLLRYLNLLCSTTSFAPRVFYSVFIESEDCGKLDSMNKNRHATMLSHFPCCQFTVNCSSFLPYFC